MHVEEVRLNGEDATSAQILAVYAKLPPEYAVYRTKDRVLVHYADDPHVEVEQRGRMAQLNITRGEINGLIDGWRNSGRKRHKARAERYDRRVADALVVALEGDQESARTILQEIKQDVVDERTSWARFLYLMAAGASVLGVVALIGFITSPWFSKSVFDVAAATMDLWRGAAAGALGAFFSIAVGIRSRTVLTDLQARNNSLDAVLRVIMGVLAGTVLISLLKSGAVPLKVGDAAIPGTTGDAWMLVMIAGFLAGFSERMVPDLLAKAASTEAAAPRVIVTAAPRTMRGPLSTQGRTYRVVNGSMNGARAVYADADTDYCSDGLGVTVANGTADADLPPSSGGIAPGRA